MRLNIPDTRCTEHIHLGIQTNPDNVNQTADWLARQWAPKRAKSFRITSLRHTNYYGYDADKPTGYASMTVEYFTTLGEGELAL